MIAFTERRDTKVYRSALKIISIKFAGVLSIIFFLFAFSDLLSAQVTNNPERPKSVSLNNMQYNTAILQAGMRFSFLSFSPESLRFYSADEGVVRLAVISNRNWILKIKGNWIRSETNEGGGYTEVIFKAEENPEPFERLAKIEIKAEGLPVKILMISQKPRHDE